MRGVGVWLRVLTGADQVWNRHQARCRSELGATGWRSRESSLRNWRSR